MNDNSKIKNLFRYKRLTNKIFPFLSVEELSTKMKYYVRICVEYYIIRNIVNIFQMLCKNCLLINTYVIKFYLYLAYFDDSHVRYSTQNWPENPLFWAASLLIFL